MPKYYGCPCEGCAKPLTLKDDIVVCPDCGAPYHRDCYEKLGRCIHTPAHGAGYEWKFPYQDAALRTCPSCGERTLRSEPNCRCCGAALPPESAAEPNDRRAAQNEQNETFDYDSFYRQNVTEPTHQNVRTAFGQEELIDGIPSSDWSDYIGKAAPAYLNDYSRMQLQHTKISMSFSALLFGPFYFFYRKAWKPAFAFLAAELVLALPTLLDMMRVTNSPLTAGLSTTTLVILSRVMSILSFVLVMVRTLFAKWLYRKSAASHIKRIRSEFPDEVQRRAVLNAQGGGSWAAVVGAFVLLMVLGACFTLLMGPDLSALTGLVG